MNPFWTPIIATFVRGALKAPFIDKGWGWVKGKAPKLAQAVEDALDKAAGGGGKVKSPPSLQVRRLLYSARSYGLGLALDDLPARANLGAITAPSDWEPLPHVDNSEYLAEALDQGQTPQCSAFSMRQLAFAYRWRLDHKKPQGFDPTVLYAKAKELDRNDQPGTSSLSVITAARLLKWIPDPVTLKAHTCAYPDLVKFALQSHGLVLLGLNIDNGWEFVRSDGVVPDGNTTLGPHLVVCSGYEDAKNGNPERYRILNSWGVKFGCDGFCWLTRNQLNRQWLHGTVFSLYDQF